MSMVKRIFDICGPCQGISQKNGYDALQDAIERAIDHCIEKNVLRSFLIKNRSEVVKAMTLDYTFDRQIMLEREEARTEGHREGRQDGLKALISTCKELGISFDETAAKVKEKFSLEDEEARKNTELYW